MSAPPLSDSIVATALDPAARRDLGGLQKDLAEAVARHLVAAGSLVDEDPQAALAHARYARRRASRIAVVREAAGIAAYHAGEWAEALAELRAARRMGGGPGHLAVMADVERAMGRPERAIEVARGPEARELGRNAQVELAIVVAGARRDLGELDAAVVGLQIPELDPTRRDPWSARLFYAYADNLLAAGRESDALQWFVHAIDADADGETDADARVAELTGEPLPDEGIEFGLDDERDDDEDIEDDDEAASDDDTSGGATVSADSLDEAAVDHDELGRVTEPTDGLDETATAHGAPVDAMEPACALDEAIAGDGTAASGAVDGATVDRGSPGDATAASGAVDEAAVDRDAPGDATAVSGAADEAATDRDAPGDMTAPSAALDEAAADDGLGDVAEPAVAPDEASVDQNAPSGAADSAPIPDGKAAGHEVPGDPAEPAVDDQDGGPVEAESAAGSGPGLDIDTADDRPTSPDEAADRDAPTQSDQAAANGAAHDDVNGSAHVDGAPNPGDPDWTTLTDVESSVPGGTAGR